MVRSTSEATFPSKLDSQATKCPLAMNNHVSALHPATHIFVGPPRAQRKTSPFPGAIGSQLALGRARDIGRLRVVLSRATSAEMTRPRASTEPVPRDRMNINYIAIGPARFALLCRQSQLSCVINPFCGRVSCLSPRWQRDDAASGDFLVLDLLGGNGGGRFLFVSLASGRYEIDRKHRLLEVSGKMQFFIR